jgi:hypothetical protein
MPPRSRKTQTIATQAAELALAVPQVVAHRAVRMALAGPAPSERDRREFELMVAEKNTAFVQSWRAMGSQTLLAHQALAMSMLHAAWSPARWGQPANFKLANQAQAAALGILGKGLSPIHRKAVANAKRLARTKLR